MSHLELVHSQPDVYLLVLPLRKVPFKSVNCYIIVDGADYLVCDPGEQIEENVPLIDEALADLGLDRNRMRIYLTHLHSDHSGMVDLLATPETPVYAGRRDFAYHTLEADPAVWEAIAQQLRSEGVPEIEANMAMTIRSGRAHVPSADRFNILYLDAGMHVQVGRWDFETVGVSGHSPEGMALYHRPTRLMIVGDHVLYGMTPVIDSTREMGNGLRNYVESLRMLGDMDIATMLPGHGKTKGDHYERMKKMADRKLLQAASIRTVIAENPGIIGYEAVRSISWSAVKEVWENAPLGARAFIANDGCITLDYLVETGAVRRELGADGINCYWAAGE